MSELKLPKRSVTVPRSARIALGLLVPLARAISRLPPVRIHQIMQILARGAEAAPYEVVSRARDSVLTTSPYCRGTNACLPRTIAVALWCRCGGHWPAWKVGVLRTPPFMAHAWVETPSGDIVDEAVDSKHFAVLLDVSASPRLQPTEHRR